jgi:3-hydroxyisobutyrate dehydrogenase-like beta-hydroxyacid dehydrogenase
MKVGFVGLGQMGSGMAASLLKAGHEVIVYNRTRAKAELLIAQGARVVASVADALPGECRYHHAGKRQRRRGRGARQRWYH